MQTITDAIEHLDFDPVLGCEKRECSAEAAGMTVIVPCGCTALHCEAHRRQYAEELAMALRANPGRVVCSKHGGIVHVTGLHWEPLS